MLTSMPLVQAADGEIGERKHFMTADTMTPEVMKLEPKMTTQLYVPPKLAIKQQISPSLAALSVEQRRREQELPVKWDYWCKECNKILTNGQDDSIENHTMRKHNACYDCDFKGSPKTVENHRIAVHLKKEDIRTMNKK